MMDAATDLKVLDVRLETPSAYSIRLEKPPGERWHYLPGQYVTVLRAIGHSIERRYFSLSSSPIVDPYLQVTIKAKQDGRVSAKLRRVLRPGDTLTLLPPEGNFTVTPDPAAHRQYVLIAAGSGITPLWSILRSVLAIESHSRIALFFGNRTADEIIFRHEMDALQSAHAERLSVTHVLSQPAPDWPGERGRLDRDRVKALVQTLDSPPDARSYFLCGPDGMMWHARRALYDLQIPPSRIFQEYFVEPFPDEEPATTTHREPHA